MLKNVVIAILTILIVGCSSSVDEADIISKEGLTYQTGSEKPFSGEVFSSYESGEKEYSVQYENGVKIGEYTFYNKDGSVTEAADMDAILTERDNKFFFRANNSPYSGKVFSLNEKGEKVAEGMLLKGLKAGLWKTTEADEYSTYTYEQEFDDGLQNGNSITYLNGNLFSEVSYVNGKEEGQFTQYLSNGDKREEAQFLNGVKISWTNFSQGGVKKESFERNYDEGIDKVITFHENGNKKEEYFNDYFTLRYEGKFTTWFENGQKWWEGNYEQGKAVGEWKYWDRNGNQTNKAGKPLK